jgi:hypothetical protein
MWSNLYFAFVRAKKREGGKKRKKIEEGCITAKI